MTGPGMDSYCRSCSRCDEFQAVSLEEISESNEVSIALMLAYCTKLEIFVGDRLPQKICYECFTSLETFFAFRRVCRQNDVNFQQMVSREATAGSKEEQEGSRTKAKQTCGGCPGEFNTAWELVEHLIESCPGLVSKVQDNPVPVVELTTNHVGVNTSEIQSGKILECRICGYRTEERLTMYQHHNLNKHTGPEELEKLPFKTEIGVNAEHHDQRQQIPGNDLESLIKLEPYIFAEPEEPTLVTLKPMEVPANSGLEVNEPIITEREQNASEVEHNRIECIVDNREIANITIKDQLENKLLQALDTTPANECSTVKLTEEKKPHGNAQEHLGLCDTVHSVLDFSGTNRKTVLQCEMCPYQTVCKRNLRRHQFSASHTGIRQILGQLVKLPEKYSQLTKRIACRVQMKCKQCSYSTTVRSELNVHRRTESHVGIEKRKIPNKYILECNICGYQTEKTLAMYQHHHSDEHTGPEKQEIPQINSGIDETKTQVNQNASEVELERIESTKNIEDQLESKLQQSNSSSINKKTVLHCEMCTYKTTEPSKMRRHQLCKGHTGVRKIIVQLARMPKQYSQLTKRIVCRGQLKCNQCSYLSTVRSELDVHQQTEGHVGVKKRQILSMRLYECKICGYLTEQHLAMYQHHILNEHIGPEKQDESTFKTGYRYSS